MNPLIECGCGAPFRGHTDCQCPLPTPRPMPAATIVSDDSTMRIDALVAAGYRPVSNKYRLAVALPPGKTGLEALREVAPDLVAHWERNLEEQARDFFCRVHGHDQVTLSAEEYAELKRRTR